MGGPLIIPDELLAFDGTGLAGAGQRTIIFPKTQILRHLEETHNVSVYNEAYLVPEVCANPTGIWRGLDRAGQDGTVCYAGKPTGDFARRHGIEVDFSDDDVFLVYLTDQLHVIKWRFCEQDPNRPGFPVDHGTRFGERLWPQD
jgi:hypothetical protein